MNSPDFWSDQSRAKKITRQLSQINDDISHIGTLKNLQGDLETYLVLLDEDSSLLTEAEAELKAQKQFIEKI